MGLFGSDTHRITKTYGKAETAALQPGLFDAWRRMYGGGGAPFMPQLSEAIQQAYARARAEAPENVRGEMGVRGGIAGNLLRGQTGVEGQSNMLNNTGQMASYLGALTGQRPQYAFDASTPWDDAMGGMKTLLEPIYLAQSIIQAQPDGGGGAAGPPPMIGAGSPGGAGASFPLRGNNAGQVSPGFRLEGLPSF